MRNTRSAKSAFHAEIKNKFTDEFFISDYYPINFIASDRYVFYNTLYQKSGTGINLASKAATWLYGPMRNPTRNFRGNPNSKYMEALQFLESAANVEYARESAFLDKYAANNPELKMLIDDCMDAGADKYINLITALNLALKGKDRFEMELNKEIERIESRQHIMNLDEQAAKEGRYVAVKKGSNKQKLTSKEYAQRNELNGDSTMGDTILNPYYNFDGKKIFDSMFKKNSDFSIIAENIMLKYGSQLLDTKNGIMRLNKQQAVAMIKVLIQEAYNTLVIEFSDIMKKVQGKNHSSRRERLEEKLNEMTSSGGHLDQLFKEFANSSDPATALTSIAEQYHIPVNTEEIKTLGHSTKTLNTRIKKIYDAEKTTGKTKLSYRAWRKEKNLTEKDMREFVYMMANIKAQAYYTNEGMALADIIKKGGFGAVGGGVNAPTDVNGGFLICTFSYDEYPETIQQKARELISGAETKLSAVQARALEKQQKVTDKDSYAANINSLQEMQTEQLEILKRLKNSLKQLGIDAQDMITHINIHETIKGYASIDATTDQFKGASFGTTLVDQVGIINEMLCNANISQLDADWLIFAMINCGEGMIGSGNKHALEDYLSGYVGLLMFSDASFIAQDIHDYMNNILVSDISNIHLYVLNDKYVPSSYILHETYIAMNKFLNQIEAETNGTTVTLTTYSSPNAYATWTPESERTGKPWTKAGLAGPAWTAEGEAALENTHLTMYFISNFLGLLQQLQQQLQSI